ncbi:acyltransferase domain-containing protein [Kribbella sp. NPDC056861]|uniref:acyltransferase domain-containing protein n=1 Tax=Kribbella sp. NPDC056861 TaxID=3154857 RepID=UPI00344A79CB
MSTPRLAELRRLGVPEGFLGHIVDSWPDPDRTPEAWQALQNTCDALRADIGALAPSQEWPDPPLDQRYFYFQAFATIAPDVRRWHADHGVSDEVSRASLADLGNKVAQTGKQNWLAHHFRGRLLRLGRFQFEPTPEGLLEVHIPGDGPMPPEACDDSFAQAAAFYGPDYPQVTCHSWLLDEQLNDYLPPDSNIILFQQRFTPTGESGDADDFLIEAVFGQDADRSSLPRDTTLQRAIIDHLAAGNHWYHRTGRLTLPR